MIYNRDRLAAVVVDPEEYSRYSAWREREDHASLAEGAARVREVAAAEQYELVTVQRSDRDNALSDALVAQPR